LKAKEKHIFDGNPLVKGIPFCAFKTGTTVGTPQFIALVLESDRSSKLIGGMSDIMAAWRTAFRMNDIIESKIGSLDQKRHEFREIPHSIIVSGVLSLLESWSLHLRPQQGSVKDSVTAGSKLENSVEAETLDAFGAAEFSTFADKRQNAANIVGAGCIPLRINYVLSEINRSNRNKAEIFDECAAEERYAIELMAIKAKIAVKPKIIVIGSHASSCSLLLAAHLRYRLISGSDNAIKDAPIINLDLNLSSGITDRESLGLWLAENVFKKNMPILEATTRPQIMIVNLILSSSLNIEFSSLLNFLDFFSDVELVMSMISPANVDTGREHTRASYSLWNSNVYELCHPSSTDILVFLAASAKARDVVKDATTSTADILAADRIRLFCKSLNASGVSVSVTAANIWLDEDLIEAIIAQLVHQSPAKEIQFLSKQMRSILFEGCRSFIPKLRLRSSVILEGSASNLVCSTLFISPDKLLSINEETILRKTGLKLDSPREGTKWSISRLSELLRKLFPDAAVTNTMSDKVHWRIPRCQNSGLRRALLLAKVKVMTARQDAMGSERLFNAIKKLQGILGHTFDSMCSNLRTVHGVIALQLNGNSPGTMISKYVSVEASVGSIVIKEVIKY